MVGVRVGAVAALPCRTNVMPSAPSPVPFMRKTKRLLKDVPSLTGTGLLRKAEPARFVAFGVSTSAPPLTAALPLS